MKVLSIGGGGVKVIGPASLLEIKKNKCEVSDFDIYVGTSSGAILSSLLAFGCSYSEAVVRIEGFARKVFAKRRSLLRRLFSRYFSLYSSSHHKELCKELFSDLPEGPIKPLFITRYNINRNKGDIEQIFDKRDLVEQLVCTIAAPFYFDPVFCRDTFYIDGGFFANNPLLAFINHIETYGVVFSNGISKTEEVDISSLVVTSMTHGVNDKEIQYGKVRWYNNMFPSLVDGKFNGHSSLVLEFVKTMVKNLESYDLAVNVSLDDVDRMGEIKKKWCDI